jgi:hypothetical protein
MTKILAFIYFMTVGWTGVILFQEWIRPYILISIIITLFLLFKTFKINKIYYKLFDLRDLLLVFFIIYSIILGLFFSNSKTLNYILAYSFVLLIAYSLNKYFFLLNLSYKSLHYYNYVGVCILLLYGLIEITFNNFLNNNIVESLWKYRDNGALASISNHTFIRSYGMMPEPGIFGLYLNSLGLIALFYSNRKKTIFKKTTFNICFMINYYFISSDAALVSLILSIIAISILLSKHKIQFIKLFIYVISSILILFYLIPTFGITLFDKLLNPQENSLERYENWLLAYELIANMTGVGNGLGYVSTNYGSSVNNWYFMLIIETGIIGLGLILFFLFLSLKKGIVFGDEIIKPYIFGILANIIHFGAISTFFNPFLFLTIAMMDIEIFQRLLEKNQSSGVKTNKSI